MDLTCKAARECQTMAANSRGVGGCKKGGRKTVEQNGRAAGNRTFPSAMSVRNLGQSPHVLGLQAILNGGLNRLPSRGGKRTNILSPLTVRSVLSMAVVPEEWRAFQQRFNEQKWTVGSSGRLMNSWVVGHRSVWLQTAQSSESDVNKIIA